MVDKANCLLYRKLLNLSKLCINFPEVSQVHYYTDLAVLIDFTSSNPSIENYHPLMLGYQTWKDNRLQLLFMSGMNITTIPESIYNLDHLEHLNISHNNLTTLPNSLCEIYPNLKGIDLGNNFLCPPYLECIKNISYQNTQDCDLTDGSDQKLERDNITDINSVYFQNDLEVLQGFINNNKSLAGKHPLEIGQQKWESMRLVSLDLSDKELTAIPTSICSITSSIYF